MTILINCCNPNIDVMALEQPTVKDVKRAEAYIDELLSDPTKFERWADKVVKGWLKSRKSYRRS